MDIEEDNGCGTHSQREHKNSASTERRLLYLGNYGFRPDSIPQEVDIEAADFIDNRLREHLILNNVVSWANNKLRVLADMLDDREQPYFASELREIKNKLSQKQTKT